MLGKNGNKEELKSNIQATVVIRCYNEERYIGRLLNGIMQQGIRELEIIVVDSGSTDQTLAIVARFPAKILSIRPEEFSFGRSLNIGCEAANGEFIVIASAHVYPLYRDWLEKLLYPFLDTKIALVYGKQRGQKGTKFSEHQVLSKWFPDQSNWDQKNPFCNNANAAIRHAVWQELPYDEDLTGLEDIDWAVRAMRLGSRIAYEADAETIHVHNETSLQTFSRYRREAIAMKRIFPHEHFHFGHFVRLFLTNVSSDYRQAAHDRVLMSQWPGILRFRLMQFWGTYHGFASHAPVSNELKQTFYYPNRKRKTSSKLPVYKGKRPLVNYRSEERLRNENH